MIGATVAQLRRDAGTTVEPNRRGPVRLEPFLQLQNIRHHALPQLTSTAVVAHLRASGVSIEDREESDTPLTGFLYWTESARLVYVQADHLLHNRRFIVAHELGHVILHREQIGSFHTDTTVGESDTSSQPLEQEANDFATELLMPAEILQARAEELRRLCGACSRGVLAYRLAAELLVSGSAIRNRLDTLGVGDD
ncbi:MAG: ImmA/IrrE family metallo-endopeptidase [Bacteroidales bacterium]|nr:ImmA/IrrE family metallo-endopeptidase [Bacteroidales bacterium]